MEDFHQFIFDNFHLLFGFSVIWCCVWAAFFAWQHVRRGQWHPDIADSQVLFSERFVSGFSHKNLFTKFGGARNALTVTVCGDAVLIEPVAPFKWVMPPGFIDLEHYIARKNIQKVAPISRWSREGVVIEFRDETGGAKSVELFLRRPERFLALFST